MAIFFKNTADLKKSYNEISVNTDFQTLINPLRQVTQIFIEPYLGSDLTAELAATATADTEPTGINKEVITSLKDAIVNYFIFQELPNKKFILSGAGAKTANGEHTSNLSLAEIKFTQSQAIRRADSFLDRALKLISQNPEDFESFKPEALTGSQFFKSSAELENCIMVKGFRAFALMSKFLKRVEQDEVLQILGQEFLEEVLTNADSNISKLAIFMYCRNFIANKALYYAIPHLNFIIDGEGLKVLSSTDAEDKRSHVTEAHQKNLSNFIGQALKDAEHFKKTLLGFLFRNAADFPTWQTSDFYLSQIANATTSTRIIGDDTPSVGFFR